MTTPVVAALTVPRDHRLVVDRDSLNRAWSELTVRATPTSGTRCQHPGCHDLGATFLEPAGVWCPEHRPSLWRDGGRPWATPRCHRCGQPGAYPNRGNTIARPVCRDHAPRWMTPLLIDNTNGMENR